MSALQPGPAYLRIAAVIEERITTGKIQPGERLPSELDLAGEFEVSRPTIRRSIEILSNAGLVRVEHGLGTFAVAPGEAQILSRAVMAHQDHKPDYDDLDEWLVDRIRAGLAEMPAASDRGQAFRAALAASLYLAVEPAPSQRKPKGQAKEKRRCDSCGRRASFGNSMWQCEVEDASHQQAGGRAPMVIRCKSCLNQAGLGGGLLGMLGEWANCPVCSQPMKKVEFW